MISIYTGSVFEAPVQAVMHQANCFHTMGSGIAKTIRELYPEAYEADLQTAKGDKEKLGSFSAALIRREREFYIVNLYSQFGFSSEDYRDTDYNAMADGLEAVHSFCMEKDIKTIGVPYKMGSDRGGGDWTIVEAILKSVFSASDIELVIAKLENL